MVCESNGTKNICIFVNVMTMQIIPRNEIPGNSALLKVTSTEKYVYQVNKKVPFQKLMQLAPTLTSELRHIHNSWHIQNLGKFKSSTVFRCLLDILQCLWKLFPGYTCFCRMLLLRLYQMFGRILNTPMYLQVHSDIFEHYSRACVYIQNLVNLWYIQNPGIFLSKSIFRLQGVF